MAKIAEQLYVADRKTWRAWLEKNHTNAKGVWLIYYKKHTVKKGISYEEAAEEALCFGWIDSLVKKIDEHRYARKFTPRKDGSNWSELNKKRAMKMIEKRHMTRVGLAKIEAAEKNGKCYKPMVAIQPVLDSDLESRLQENNKAWENFKNLAPTYQKHYVGWISSAKRIKTHEKRVAEAIKLLSQNKKLGLK